jgi:hypothetical protein
MSDELVLFRTLFDSSPNLTILNINNNCNEITKELQSIVDDSFGNLIIKQSHEIQPKNFRLQDRNFEYAIISDYLHLVENQDRFITSIYHSLEELLDKNNFRAVNDINIFEKYHLVMGKKLHMWGAGQ